MLEDTINKPCYERMYQKIHSRKGRRMKKIRSATVEPVLGTLLGFCGMRKVYTKGIDLANKHVLLACAAYNIKKWMRFKAIQSIAQAVELREMKAKAVLLSLLNGLDEWFSLFCNHSIKKSEKFIVVKMKSCC